MYQSIPNEMKMFPQWIVWRYEDTESPKPTKVPYSPRTASHALVDDPSTWATFDEAVHCIRTSTYYAGIGFVLTDNDPFTFIDLDDPKELKPDGTYKHKDPEIVAQRQIKIYQEFDSYAEKSPSGNGLHIIVRGQIPSGRRRSSIEIYSTARYMTMTGDVFRNAPIRDYHDMANVLWEQIGKGSSASAFYAGLEHAKHTDEQVLEIARHAANGEKFSDLYDLGDFSKWGYPSQSEADLALIDIIAFYSENRQQVQKLFLQSKLGQRPKSRAQYRLNYMLNKCFDHMLPPVDVDGLRDQLNAALERRVREQIVEQNVQHLPVNKAEPTGPVAEPERSIYTVPPGLLGEIAKFIYSNAVRPVPEIALAGAIGLMAGITGRAYNTPTGTGLNQYILLLARTGTGKEAIASGTAKLMAAIKGVVPTSTEYVGPGEIASPQALIKYLSNTSKSFMSIVGEFGIALQQMSTQNAPPHLVGLRRMLLDIFNKSGNGDVLRMSIYSDKEKNTSDICSPAMTLVGESTPERFYEGIHEGMISEGLLPRFTIVEYLGDRPDFNPNHMNATPSNLLLTGLSQLCANASSLNAHNRVVNVGFADQQTSNLFRDFNAHCDAQMKGVTDDVVLNLWNRCHVKALKLASLIAVGCDFYHPAINMENANWAINLVLEDCSNVRRRFERGEVGQHNEEHQQLEGAIKAFKSYVVTAWKDFTSSYLGTTSAALHGNRIITYSFLHKRLAQTSVYRKDKMQATFAIKRALKTLAERGDIQEISKATAAKEHGYNGICYMITNLKAFGL